MSQLNESFNSNDHEEVSFDLIPNCEAPAVIVDSKIKDTSNGKGRMISLTIQIIDGPHKKRLLWENLVLWHESEKAVQIARGKLSSICKAVNTPVIEDTQQLHNKPMLIKVGIRKGKNGYEDSNVIKKYSPISGSGNQVAQNRPQPTPASNAAETPAWQSNAPAAASVDDVPF